MTNETDYCNDINEKINEHFRVENDGCDSDVFVDELIEDGVIALNWHTFLDGCVNYHDVQRVAQFVFGAFPEVQRILSPDGDFERTIW